MTTIGAPQQNNSVNPTVRTNPDGTYCHCKLKGPHSSNCQKFMASPMPITNTPIPVAQPTPVVQPTPVAPPVATPVPPISNGFAIGKPVVTAEQLPPYPEGYKHFTEEGITIYLPQKSISNNSIKFEEAGQVNVATQVDWGALVGKVFIELGSNNENVDISMLEVTIKAIRS